MTDDTRPADEDIDPHALIYTLAYTVYMMSLGPSQRQADAYKWLKDPQPGDLVFETSVYYRVIGGPDSRFPRDLSRVYGAVGTLLRITSEPYGDAEEWAPEPRPMERVWYIKSLKDGNELRWTNCEFVRVPLHLEPWRER